VTWLVLIETKFMLLRDFPLQNIETWKFMSSFRHSLISILNFYISTEQKPKCPACAITMTHKAKEPEEMEILYVTSK
jgi:hypothetical protein